jgi:hypothetical protein
MTTIRLAWIAAVVGMAVGCDIAPEAAAGGPPAVATVRDPNVLEDGACEFASKPERNLPGIARVVVARNLDCEIWINVDGVDERLRSSPRDTCDRGWDLPGKGEHVRRTYLAGATRVDAAYKVTDACFVGDRCEYITFDATFRISKGEGARILRATGKCSW